MHEGHVISLITQRLAKGISDTDLFDVEGTNTIDDTQRQRSWQLERVDYIFFFHSEWTSFPLDFFFFFRRQAVCQLMHFPKLLHTSYYNITEFALHR